MGHTTTCVYSSISHKKFMTDARARPINNFGGDDRYCSYKIRFAANDSSDKTDFLIYQIYHLTKLQKLHVASTSIHVKLE